MYKIKDFINFNFIFLYIIYINYLNYSYSIQSIKFNNSTNKYILSKFHKHKESSILTSIYYSPNINEKVVILIILAFLSFITI